MTPRNKNRLNWRRSNEDGFTLIELLVVIIIIGILAAIAFLVFGAQQAEAIKASVKADVRNTVGNITASLIKDSTADPIDADPVVTDGNEVTIEGGWNDYAVYGSNDAVANWVYAYFADKDGALSQAAEAGTPAYGQWRELTTRGPDGGDATPAFAGVCESWPELKHASQVTIDTWSSPLVVDYYWHVRQSAAAEQAWLEENGDAFYAARSNLLDALGQLDNSTGPNGENGLNARNSIPDPVSNVMLNSYLDQDPSAFTADRYEEIRNLGLQDTNERCATYSS